MRWSISYSEDLVIVVIIKIVLARVKLEITSQSLVEFFSADLTFCRSRASRFSCQLQLFILPDYEFILIVAYINDRLEIK